MSDKFPGGFLTAGAPAGFSVAFGATTSKLSIASMTALGSDFTIECWVYPTSFADYNTIWDNRASDADANGCVLALNSANKVYFYTNSSFQITTTTALTANRWTHLALVRSGSGSGNVKIYINGVADATTATYTTSFSRTAASIGGDWNTRSNLQFFGYISNLRTLTTALYTTTFTPPTQLFPVTSTTLLTCQSPTIIDNSSSAVAITLAGSTTPTVSNFTPFAGYTGFNPALGAAAGGVWTLDEAAYYQNNRQWPIYDPYFKNTTLMLHGNGTNAAQNNTFLDSSTNNFTITRNGNTTQGSFSPFSQTGWSSWFDGTTNTASITTPQNAAFNFGTGDFSVEAWVYATATQSVYPIVQLGYGAQVGGPYTGWAMNMVDLTSIQFYRYDGTETRYTFSVTIPQNTWVHVAVTRSSSSMRAFLNGVQIGAAQTATTSYNNVNSDPLIIGKAQGGSAMSFPGYISNVRVIKGSAVYTNSFTPSTQPLTAVTNTVLLACQNSRLVDNSANNFPFSTTGSASVQAFSPFVPAYITPTTYSNWFDGTGDYLTAPNAAWMDLGTGSFTMECWVQFNTVGSTQMIVSSNYNAGTGGGGWAFLYRQDNTTLKFSCNSNVSYEKTWSPAAGTMYHVAVCRSGTDLRLFVNGVQLGTTSTSSDNISGSSLLAVGTNLGGTPLPINGVISNMRIVTSALYTANFTPPTAPLTAITNTQFLSCQSSTFVDNSANAATLTANGNVQPVTSPTPFPAKVDTTTLNSAYSTSLIGGSAYFDGTGDYLTLPANAAFNFNTGNFTLETWIYMPSFSTFQEIFSQGSGNFQGIGIYTTTSGKVHLDLGNGSSWYANAETTNSLKLNSWNHVAIVRQSTTYTIYLNGASDATTTTATFPSDASGASSYIAVYGPLTSQLFTGYLSGFRIVKGTGGAIYTSNFAPPVAPPTNITNTQLLTNFTNGAIFDNTAKNVLETVGNAQISTTQSKWGGSSMYFDGTNDSIQSTNNQLFDFGSGDFTIEFWFYATGSAIGTFFTKRAVNSTFAPIDLQINTNNTLQMLGSTSGSSWTINSVSTVTASRNVWNHCAVVRTGTVFTCYLNGISITTGSSSGALMTNAAPFVIGADDAAGNAGYQGYIDDFRITRGLARYTTTFTPPTSQLQDQ